MHHGGPPRQRGKRLRACLPGVLPLPRLFFPLRSGEPGPRRYGILALIAFLALAATSRRSA